MKNYCIFHGLRASSEAQFLSLCSKTRLIGFSSCCSFAYSRKNSFKNGFNLTDYVLAFRIQLSLNLGMKNILTFLWGGLS
jgi:hypothetical protein